MLLFIAELQLLVFPPVALAGDLELSPAEAVQTGVSVTERTGLPGPGEHDEVVFLEKQETPQVVQKNRLPPDVIPLGVAFLLAAVALMIRSFYKKIHGEGEEDKGEGVRKRQTQHHKL